MLLPVETSDMPPETTLESTDQIAQLPVFHGRDDYVVNFKACLEYTAQSPNNSPHWELEPG
jgi:hypothetical protein